MCALRLDRKALCLEPVTWASVFPLRPKFLTMWQDKIHLWHLPQSLFIIKGIFIKKTADHRMGRSGHYWLL